MARKKIEVVELIDPEKGRGVLAFDPRLVPDAQFLTAIQKKYPTAEASRQWTYSANLSY